MVVVGAGKIGTGLKRRADARGVGCSLVGRGEAVVGAGPIVLAVRAEQLEAAVLGLPAARHADLVLVQNGAIRELLHALGLDGVTRGALYLLAASREAELVPGRPSPFCGPHAEAVVAWLTALGLPAEEVDRDRFAAVELEKLLWLAVMGPLCEAHHATVGEVARDHADQVRALFEELAAVGEAAWDLRLDRAAAVERARAWSLVIPGYRASVKEWAFRNGWLREQAARRHLATPLHDALVPVDRS